MNDHMLNIIDNETRCNEEFIPNNFGSALISNKHLDGDDAPDPVQGPEEVDELNVHLSRKVTGHWMAKKDIFRSRTNIKSASLKVDKKRKKKMASKSRRVNKS